jgi:hypothetical protein
MGNRGLNRSWRWAGAAALSLAALAACSSGPPTTVKTPGFLDRDEPAADFSLSATVFSPEQTAAKIEQLPRSRRPARYIVQADEVLRASAGAGSRMTTFPPAARQLTHRQFRELWWLVRDSGLLDPSSPARIPTAARLVPREDRAVGVLEITAEGRHIAARVNLDQNSTESMAAEQVMDRLAELAWMRE